MGSFIESNTVSLISKALDVTSLRQQASAQNIANANTPDYRKVEVRFETYLADARASLARGQALGSEQIQSMQPTLDIVNAGNSDVVLEEEIAHLSENALHQQALLKALKRHYSIVGAAIHEGRN